MEQDRLAISLLGGFAAHVDGEPVPNGAWRLRRAKSLVKLLALTPERRLHREQVVELLWPGGDPAGKGLHQVLYTARRALGEEAGARLALRDDVVALDGDGLWVDVDAFEEAAAEARAQPGVDRHAAAVALYSGELLPEDRYEDWTTARRQSLREMHLGLLIELAELQVAAGDAAGAVESLQRAVVEDPLHEPAHRELMRLFAATGRRQQALAQYQQLRQALKRELEADPDPETRALYRELLAEPDQPPQPERAPSALPHQLTSFVGRRRELGELEEALRHTRLLTLTGPGGCGKTRLALELAARREEAFEGVGVVELAPVADPALVVEETARALGARQLSERDPVEVLSEQIAERRLLLVLDNCEHLIDACARLADRLLRACPNLHVVATSRERLRITGEVAWRVPPLSLPQPADRPELSQLVRSEAIDLFCQRAAEAAPGFTLDEENAAAVADICRRLDGMPLALELAAARAAALSPGQISERLGDSLALLRGGSRAGLTRQQTLRATLAWSHDLLTGPEQTLYRRLGVFAGSFGVEAAEGICADDAVPADLELLLQLVEKSLVQADGGVAGHRYSLLETVRQDARERLAAAGERERLESRHREWYLALAESADRDVDPEVAADWPPERLEEDHDNLRAALASAIRHHPPTGLRLACAIWWFWMARALFVEGSRWLDDALAAAPEPTPERARALLATGAIRVRRRSTLNTVPLGEEALSITRGVCDRNAEARGLERLGVMGMGGYEWDAADRALTEGLELARELGDDVVEVAVRHAQGVLAGCRGDNAEARELLEDCLRLLTEIPDSRGPLFWAMHISPVVVPGPSGAPRSFFEDTFILFRSVQCRAGAGYTLCSIGEAWRAEGDYAAAGQAFHRALDLFRELSDEPGTSVALNALGNLARSTGEIDLGWERFEEALSIRRAMRDPRDIAMTLMGMAMLALSARDEPTGQRLMGEAQAIFERTDDGPGVQGVPLNLGACALDSGDPERAIELLRDCIRLGEMQALDRNVGWAHAELAEAALAIQDFALARSALDGALSVLGRTRNTIGLQYARELEDRLGALAPG